MRAWLGGGSSGCRRKVMLDPAGQLTKDADDSFQVYFLLTLLLGHILLSGTTSPEKLGINRHLRYTLGRQPGLETMGISNDF